MLNNALNEGLHRQEIRFNPVSVVGQVAESTKDHGIFSVDELRKIFSNGSPWGYDPEHPGRKDKELAEVQAYDFAYLFATPGERPGTLLQVCRKDFERDLLTIRRPKSGKERTIPFVSANLDLLE